jgi:hypothetical protein
MKQLHWLAVAPLLLSACEGDPVRPENRAPEVVSITAGVQVAYAHNRCPITCVATDADGDRLTFEWVVGSGYFTGTGSDIVYTPTSCCLGGNPVLVTVRDGRGGETRAALFLPVTP